MKPFIFIFCWFCASSLPAQSGPQEQVTGLMKEQELSWNNGDIRGFMQHYWNNDSLTFIGSKGVTYGWQKTLDNYLKSYPTKESMGTLGFTIIEVLKLSAQEIYVIGKWHLEKEKPAGGHFTLLWRLKGGRWVIVSDHTS